MSWSNGFYFDGIVIVADATSTNNTLSAAAAAAADGADNAAADGADGADGAAGAYPPASSYTTNKGFNWVAQVVYYHSQDTYVLLGDNDTQVRVVVRTYFVDVDGNKTEHDEYYVTNSTGDDDPTNFPPLETLFFSNVSSSRPLTQGIYSTDNSATLHGTGGTNLTLADQRVGHNGSDHYCYTVFLLQTRTGSGHWSTIDQLFIPPSSLSDMTGIIVPSGASTCGAVTWSYDNDDDTVVYAAMDVNATNTGNDYRVWRRRQTGATANSQHQGSGGGIATTTAANTGTGATTTYSIAQWTCIDATLAVAQSHIAWNLAASGWDEARAASAIGDPHITTLDGEHYEFDYIGPFRLYEATAGGEKLTINALAKLGPGRWNEKQYLRELYIQQGERWAHVDMGFRGSPVKILESEGLEYEESFLPFDPEAKRYSFSSKYRTTNWSEPVTADLPALVRNAIDFVIAHPKTGMPAASIHLENVNQFNLQPCRTIVHPVKDASDAKGCLVARRYATVAKLGDLRDTTPLREPTQEDLDGMPELEIAPVKRNIQWQ